MSKIEPILQEDKNRFVLFPINNKEVWQLYKKIEQKFWIPNPDYFMKDKEGFAAMKSEESQYVFLCISALILKHKIFGEKSLLRFMNEIQYTESRFFLGFSEMMCNIYYETMSEILDKLVSPKQEIQLYINKVQSLDSINKIKNWLDINYFNNDNFAVRLIIYACFKRIMFSGLMASITSLKKKEDVSITPMVMKFIFEDEGLYTDFALTTYVQLDNKENADTIKRIIKEVSELENYFMEDFNNTFKYSLLKRENVSDFTKYISSSIEESVLNNSTNSKHKNPFSFLDWERSFIVIDKNKKEYVMDRTIKFDADF